MTSLPPSCQLSFGNIFLCRSQYELSRMFSVFSFVKFLSCMDNVTSYQTACCGVIDNVAILHWLNIISYAHHHDMNNTLYNLYIKTTKEDKTKVYAIHMSGEMQPNKAKVVCNTHIGDFQKNEDFTFSVNNLNIKWFERKVNILRQAQW